MQNDNLYWQNITSRKRLFYEEEDIKTDNRSVFDMDHDRIVFSNSFRRMHDKTQVFPYSPVSSSNQARSRLSHSLEVSCVGRSLGNLAGNHIKAQKIKINPYDIGTIVATACLSHDIGNPPFGHAGEDAIQEWSRKKLNNILTDQWEINDLINFEGNAQGFRTLIRLEAWQRKGGLRPTVSMLGTYSKYPCASIDLDNKNPFTKKFGFFKEDSDLFITVFNELNIAALSKVTVFSRHPFSFLAEAADDICYAVIDLEDAYHLNLLSFDIVYQLLAPIAHTDKNYKDDTHYEDELRLARLRSAAINSMIQQCINVFICNFEKIKTFSFNKSLINQIKSCQDYKNIKDFSLENIYSTNRVLEIESAGFKALGGLLDIFVPSAITDCPNKEETVYRKLIPNNYFKRYNSKPYAKSLNSIDKYINDLSIYQRILSVTDYISSMTDSYAIELYQRLSGIKLPVY